MHTTIVTGPKVYTSEIRNGQFGMFGSETEINYKDILHEICHLFTCKLLDSKLGILLRSKADNSRFLSHSIMAEVVVASVQNFFSKETSLLNLSSKTQDFDNFNNNKSILLNATQFAYQIFFTKWLEDNVECAEQLSFELFLQNKSKELLVKLNGNTKQHIEIELPTLNCLQNIETATFEKPVAHDVDMFFIKHGQTITNNGFSIEDTAKTNEYILLFIDEINDEMYPPDLMFSFLEAFTDNQQ